MRKMDASQTVKKWDMLKHTMVDNMVELKKNGTKTNQRRISTENMENKEATRPMRDNNERRSGPQSRYRSTT